MSAPMFTDIEESDAVVERQPQVPSVPPPMFTEIEETDVLRFRLRPRVLTEQPYERPRPFLGYR
jgi:hypothetical protein